MNAVGILATMVFLAGFNEWVLEHLFGQWRDAEGHSRLGKWLVYISAAVGVGECVVLGLNPLTMAGIEGSALLGQVVGGVVVGAGSNIVHKFFGVAVRK